MCVLESTFNLESTRLKPEKNSVSDLKTNFGETAKGTIKFHSTMTWKLGSCASFSLFSLVFYVQESNPSEQWKLSETTAAHNLETNSI